MNWTSVVRTAAAGAVAIAAATHASAQAPGTVRPITLTMGQGMPIQTPLPFAKVSVTDEKVAEVTPLSDREFIVNPRGFGSTNLFVLDAKNALVETLDITVAPSYASPTGGPAGTSRSTVGSPIRTGSRSSRRCINATAGIATRSKKRMRFPSRPKRRRLLLTRARRRITVAHSEGPRIRPTTRRARGLPAERTGDFDSGTGIFLHRNRSYAATDALGPMIEASTRTKDRPCLLSK